MRAQIVHKRIGYKDIFYNIDNGYIIPSKKTKKEIFRTKLKNNYFLIGMVARYHSVKNHNLLIEAIKILNSISIAYLSLAEADWENAPDLPEDFYKAVRNNFDGLIMYAGKYTPEKALKVLTQGNGDIFGFGRPFIANHDLVSKLQSGTSLTEYNEDQLSQLN